MLDMSEQSRVLPEDLAVIGGMEEVTVARVVKSMIRRYVEEGMWPLSATDDAILQLTYDGFSDAQIVDEITDNLSDLGASLSETEVTISRVRSLSLLLRLFENETEASLKKRRTTDELLGLRKRVAEKRNVIDTYLGNEEAGKKIPKKLAAQLDETIHSFQVQRIIGHYLEEQTDIYIEWSEDFQSTSDLAANTGYSAKWIIDLIDGCGDARGKQIGRTWYGSLSDIRLHQKKMSGRPGARVGPRRHET